MLLLLLHSVHGPSVLPLVVRVLADICSALLALGPCARSCSSSVPILPLRGPASCMVNVVVLQRAGGTAGPNLHAKMAAGSITHDVNKGRVTST